jgi:alkanesulfonate monooxygenase SsuD/methylene tetrahydromethanopterin reductase-like flavin-dependent oxidoreductase (luciferase family)
MRFGIGFNFPAERDEIAEWIRAYVDSVLKMYELGTDNFAKGEAYAEYRTKGSDFGSGTPDDAVETLTTKFMRDGIIGTPEECAEQVAAHYDIVRPSEFVVLNGYGTMPVEKARRSMELYAEKVIPRFDHLRDESDVYEPPAEGAQPSALTVP